MKTFSPRAALAARARSTRVGSEAGGSSPGQSTPRSESGSLPRPSSSRARAEEPAAPVPAATLRVEPVPPADAYASWYTSMLVTADSLPVQRRSVGMRSSTDAAAGPAGHGAAAVAGPSRPPTRRRDEMRRVRRRPDDQPDRDESYPGNSR